MDNTEDFFKNYRGRYSSYWIERWGLIPELPTSFDNANSIYELLAWLQRAFKNLLDDFQQLESEFEDFKNAIIDLLEYLIPELIRRYHNSMEFRKLFITMLKDILSGEERTWFKDFLKELLENDMREWFKDYLKSILSDPELKEFFKEYLKELLNDPSMKEWFKEYFKDLLNDPSMKEWFKEYFKDLLNDQAFLDYLRNKLGIKALETKVNLLESALKKIIANLEESGAWTGGLSGDFNSGRDIATGNINIFGGKEDGNSFIRTNNGQTENDLAGGL